MMSGRNVAPAAKNHQIQLYVSDRFLVESLVAFVVNGCAAGEGTVLVATAPNWAAVRDGLQDHGIEVDAATRKGSIVHLDAGDTLAGLLGGGALGASAFETWVAPALRRAQEHSRKSRVRVFGEMVNLLWERGEYAQAHAFEALWNDQLRGKPVTRLCAYRVDPLDPDAAGEALDRAVLAHGAILPGEAAEAQQLALERAVEEVLGLGRACMLRVVVGGGKGRFGSAPPVEQTVGWLRTNMPRLTRKVLAVAHRHAVLAV